FAPRNMTRPDVGSVKRRIARPKVVLPQPDSPTRPKVSRSRISKLTPSTARTTFFDLPNKPDPRAAKWTFRSLIEIKTGWSLFIASGSTARKFLRRNDKVNNDPTSVARRAEIHHDKSAQRVHSAARKDNPQAAARDPVADPEFDRGCRDPMLDREPT